MTWAVRGAQFTAGVVFVLIAVGLLYAVRSVVAVVLVAVLFAEAIAPLVVRLRRLGARRAQAVLLIYATIGVAGSGLIWLLVQALAREVSELAASMPELQTRLADALEMIPVPQARDAVARSIDASTGQPLALTSSVPGVLRTGMSLMEAMLGVFSVLVVAFYWIAEQRSIRRALLGLLPACHRQRGDHVWNDVEDKIGAWVRGQLALMAAIGTTFSIGLTLLGVKYAVLLGAVAACTELLPIIGPWLGTAPAVMIALTQSVPLALVVLAFGVGVQLFETNVLLPRLLGHATGVSPLVVFLSILVGAQLLGVLGALLAVPVAAGVQVLLQDLRATPVAIPTPHDEPVVTGDAA